VTVTNPTEFSASHHAALGVPVRARESRGAVEVAGSAVEAVRQNRVVLTNLPEPFEAP